MPCLDGIGLTREVRRRHPSIAVLILSGYDDEMYLSAALNAGAAGYILKGSSARELEMAIRAVARREAYLTPKMAKELCDERSARNTRSTTASRNQLTVRQRQTLHLITAGKTNKEIAVALNITVKTVEKHRMELMHRLGVHNAAELVRFAIQNDLL